jgi:hypothetical protein
MKPQSGARKPAWIGIGILSVIGLLILVSEVFIFPDHRSSAQPMFKIQEHCPNNKSSIRSPKHLMNGCRKAPGTYEVGSSSADDYHSTNEHTAERVLNR